MKIFITALCILGLCVSAIAADDLVLNDDVINKFINVFSQYKEIAWKYGENTNNINAIPKSLKFKEERDQLFRDHGLTPESFSLLLQKIAIGITIIKLKKSDTPDMLPGLQQLSTASEDELAVIEKNLSRLEQFFKSK